MLINYPSVIRRIQRDRSLLFNGTGGAGQTVTFDVPQISFVGQVVGSAWYKIDGNPPSGSAGFVTIQNPPNVLSAGIEFDGTNNGKFYADLNGSRFESPDLFDADTYIDWMHFAFYIDWETPANSLLFWNGVSIALTVPAANSTQFPPLTAEIDLNNVVLGVEWAEVWLSDPGGFINETNFESAVLSRLSNGVSSFGLTKRGGVMSTRPWIYLSFQEKESFSGTSDGLINDANGDALDFGTFTSYVINTDAQISLPALPLREIKGVFL